MRSPHRSSFQSALAIELARSGLNQRDLARLLGMPDTTLSDWLRGAHPAPRDLPTRIEQALKVRPGALSGLVDEQRSVL